MGIVIDRNVNSECFSVLDELKTDYYKSYDMSMLYHPINTHPDLQIHFVSTTHAVVAPCAFEHYRCVLPDSVFIQKGSADPTGTYPGDISYNIARVGKRIIGNLKYTDKMLLKIYTSLGYELVNVKQGYTKCNLCIVDEESVITEDEGLFKTLSGIGMDVLYISSNEIALDGFPYGFIGGSSGFISEKTLAFWGDITKHSFYPQIKKFINSKNVNIKCLLSTKLVDFGSILYF